MEKVTLTRVSVTDKKKDGTILENKNGKFYRIGIQTKEYPEQWINGFSNETVDWQEGDVMELEVSKELWNGAEQMKFKLPSKGTQLEARVDKLEQEVFGENKETEAVINVDEDKDGEPDKPF